MEITREAASGNQGEDEFQEAIKKIMKRKNILLNRFLMKKKVSYFVKK